MDLQVQEKGMVYGHVHGVASSVAEKLNVSGPWTDRGLGWGYARENEHE